jgi:hypothetical protein
MTTRAKHTFLGVTLIVVGITCCIHCIPTELAADSSVPPSPSTFLKAMLSQRYDLRLAFYGSLTDLQTVEANGQVLLVRHAVLETADRVSTNDCPTLESAVKRCGLTHIPTQPQIRVIQRNRILQSGFYLDEAFKRELSDLKLGSGDVVVIARRAF